MRRLLTLVASYILLAVSASQAQVVPDNTLPNNSEVSEELEVTGGTRAGNNLFHSFEDFSIETGETVFFNNAAAIDNIINRVTGGNISDIDGLIRANGTADLFLINPNGIIFGENAALDIGGSFISTTAESLQFADGTEFSAANPDATPLLTLNIPVGLQYGSNPGDITLQGVGNNLSIDPDTLQLDRDARPVGLEVSNGNTLALVGGNVFLPGGNLTIAEGRAVIGSVGNNSSIALIPDSSGWVFDYARVSNFQDIDLSQAASVEVSGSGGGEVRLQGRNIRLADGSAILADTLGDSPGKVLEISATENIELTGFTSNESFPTRLSTDVGIGATGNGGDLLLDANNLLISNGAQVTSGTFGLGNAGNLEVTASNVEISGESISGNPFGLSTQADFGDTGDGGNLSIITDRLLVTNEAEISTITFGLGNAGNLNIEANNIELSGSGLFADSLGEGNGGDLSLETNLLLLTQGAQISASTFGLGNAGNLNIQANTIELSNSGLFVGSEGEGIGGNIILETNFLSLTEGAQITATTSGLGNAGNLNIQANTIELSASGLFANSEGEGDGGNLSLETDNLSLADGAQISAITSGSGDAGTIKIDSQQINISGTSVDNFPSTISADTNSIGAGGNIEITTESLEVSAGAQISNGTSGTGNGGNLDITATDFMLLQGSSETGSSGLFAPALESDGAGGNLTVQTPSLSILDGATITVSNVPSSSNSPFNPGQGAAGDLNIIADEIEIENNSSITADTVAGDRGNINLQTDLLLLRRNSQVSTNAQNTSTGGNITIDASDGLIVAFPEENSDITANAVFGDGGRVDIETLNILGIQPRASLTPLSDITTSSQFGIAGNITLNTQDVNPAEDLGTLPDDPNPPELAQGCQRGNSDRFVNIGQGGLNPQPNEALSANELLDDVTLPQEWTEQNVNIVEAKNWIVNEEGLVELVADLPNKSVLYNCQL